MASKIWYCLLINRLINDWRLGPNWHKPSQVRLLLLALNISASVEDILSPLFFYFVLAPLQYSAYSVYSCILWCSWQGFEFLHKQLIPNKTLTRIFSGTVWNKPRFSKDKLFLTYLYILNERNDDQWVYRYSFSNPLQICNEMRNINNTKKFDNLGIVIMTFMNNYN